MSGGGGVILYNTTPVIQKEVFIILVSQIMSKFDLKTATIEGQADVLQTKVMIEMLTSLSKKIFKHTLLPF